ncbi:hypothetical protein D3C85_1139530 [compost metagenome]
MVLRVAGRLDRGGIAIQAWLVLRGFPGQETVEVLEPVARRPGIERAGCSGVEGRGVVPFAEGGGAVAILLEHLGHGRRTLGDFSGIAVPVGGQFGDHAVADAVVVAPGQQGGAGGGADGGCVEGVIAHTAVGHSAQGRGMDGTANGVGLRESGIVEHDHQDVRCIGRQVGLLLALLMPGLLQRRLGVAGRGCRREGQCVLRGGSRTGEQQAQLQCELPGGRQLLGHG